MRVIGAADEFWRIRLTRVDATEAPDFEWREDVLYRAARETPTEERERYEIEAIRIEDYETVIRIASFDDRTEAEELHRRVTEDLAEMTKSEFEDAYLSPREESAETPPAL